MNFIIFLTSVYIFVEIIVAGYVEFKSKNKITGIVLYLLSIFCLIAPNLVL